MPKISSGAIDKVTIRVDAPSKPSTEDAKLYDIPSDLEHVRFFSGDRHHPYTPPILHFSTPPPPFQKPIHHPTPDQEATQLLFDELKSQLPHDFRRNRYRRKLLQKRTMESLRPSTRERINNRKFLPSQRASDKSPDDPSLLYSDTRAYIRRLLREVDMETQQYQDINRGLREAELEEAGHTLKWEQRLEKLKEENQQLLQKSTLAPALHSNRTLMSYNGTLDTNGFLDMFD